MMYVYVMLSLFLVLNLIDVLLTLLTFMKKGYRIEGNPILRDLLRDSVDKFLLFKLFDVSITILILYWISLKNEVFTFILLGLCILLYSYIDYKNYTSFSEIYA